MKIQLLTLVLGFVFTLSGFGANVDLSNIKELSFSGYNEEGYRLTYFMRRNDKSFDVIGRRVRKGGVQMGPIGAFSQGMTCQAEGESIDKISVITCQKDDSNNSGRIDSVTVRREEDVATFGLTYSWRNVVFVENIGSTPEVKGLTLSSISFLKKRRGRE